MDTAAVAAKETPSKAGPGIEPRLLNLEDVAAYLAVSVPQVYALVRSGELPAVKIGGRGVWRVDRRRVEEYLERLEAETAAWTKAHPLQKDRGEPSGEELE